MTSVLSSGSVPLMYERIIRALRGMELEEKVVHVGLLLCGVGLFLPWLSGGAYGESFVWNNGFDFRTGLIGHLVFVIVLFLFFVTISPLLGGPIIIRKAFRIPLRLALICLSTILLLVSFSILFRATFEVSGLEIRFGIYISLVGSALALLYSFLKYQDHQRSQTHELFHHPDEVVPTRKKVQEPEATVLPPPPPPPPPPPLEDHHLLSRPS